MNFCSRNFICLYDVKESDGIVLLHLSCLWWAINFLHGHEIWDGNCVVIAGSGRLVFNNWNDMIHVDNFVLIWDLNFNITRNKRSRPLLIFSNSFEIKSSFFWWRCSNHQVRDTGSPCSYKELFISGSSWNISQQTRRKPFSLDGRENCFQRLEDLYEDMRSSISTENP